MNDPLFVRGLERLGDLLRDRQGLVQRHRSARDAFGDRRTFNQLDHERCRRVGPLETVNGRDIGMVQRGEDFGFP